MYVCIVFLSILLIDACDDNRLSSDTPTCNVEEFELKTLKWRSASGEVIQYVYLSWIPCRVAIVHLVGYEVRFVSITFNFAYLSC